MVLRVKPFGDTKAMGAGCFLLTFLSDKMYKVPGTPKLVPGANLDF